MNLIDLTVIEVLSEPYYQYNMWSVKVITEAYGVQTRETVSVDTFKEALKIKKDMCIKHKII